MARYKDIFNAVEYATSESCPNRLLAFAKVRSVAIGGAAAAQSAARQIVNRFCNVALENQRMGLWSLDLLQMCTLHGGDSFALALNNQDRLNDLLAFFLNPTKVKSVSVQIQLKLLSLIQFGNPTESATYNLQEIVSEMSTENRQLHSELQTIFKMASEQHATGVSEDPKFKKKLAEASKRTLEIKQAVYASQAFWNDIVEHLEIEQEDFKEITSNVQCIFESMEQSITYCITALKMDSSIRTEDDNSKNGGLDGDYKEGKPANTNRTGSEVSVIRLKSHANFYYSSVFPMAKSCLPITDQDKLLIHLNPAKATDCGKFGAYSNRPSSSLKSYSDPYVPLNLDKSPTTPPAPATGTNPEVRRLISKQTQTEVKESAGPPVTNVSRNAPIVSPNPSPEQTKKVSSLALAGVSYSNPRFLREDIVDVETIDAQLHGSAVHPTARAVEGAARHIPGHSIQSGIAAKPLEVCFTGRYYAEIHKTARG
ncbi:unnamed protein product [Taenia asiatica]|uniref:VHS domain-containing protein n=1 Tax=Taenia asiatica TaxID=60517 RepID=A0A0R3VW34_TAEAS|nr:unnamed protein product [Taenia asiatica]